jgi:hypothetical protein
MADEWGKRIAQFHRILGGQVNFIARAVERETNRLFGVATVEVINEKYLNFLCHGATITCAFQIRARGELQGLQQGEQDRLAYSLTGEQADQPINAEAHSAGRRHAVFQRL